MATEPVRPTAAIDIINSALFKMGVEPVADIDEDNKAARLAKQTYAQLLAMARHFPTSEKAIRATLEILL